MFTPLSKGSERRQHQEWEDRLESPTSTAKVKTQQSKMKMQSRRPRIANMVGGGSAGVGELTLLRFNPASTSKKSAFASSASGSSSTAAVLIPGLGSVLARKKVGKKSSGKGVANVNVLGSETGAEKGTSKEREKMRTYGSMNGDGGNQMAGNQPHAQFRHTARSLSSGGVGGSGSGSTGWTPFRGTRDAEGKGKARRPGKMQEVDPFLNTHQEDEDEDDRFGAESNDEYDDTDDIDENGKCSMSTSHPNVDHDQTNVQVRSISKRGLTGMEWTQGQPRMQKGKQKQKSIPTPVSHPLGEGSHTHPNPNSNDDDDDDVFQDGDIHERGPHEGMRHILGRRFDPPPRRTRRRNSASGSGKRLRHRSSFSYAIGDLHHIHVDDPLAISPPFSSDHRRWTAVDPRMKQRQRGGPTLRRGSKGSKARHLTKRQRLVDDDWASESTVRSGDDEEDEADANEPEVEDGYDMEEGEEECDDDEEEEDKEEESGYIFDVRSGRRKRILRPWWYLLLRPKKSTVNYWLDSWWRRQALFIIVPCVITWIWAAMPFPREDIGTSLNLSSLPEQPPAHLPSHQTTSHFSPILDITLPFFLANPSPISSSLATVQPTIDTINTIITINTNTAEHRTWSPPHAHALWQWNTSYPNWTLPDHLPDWVPLPKWDGQIHLEKGFLFFLFWYYGLYLAVALMFITKLFDLYRLNWWPPRLGGIASYTFFWMSSLIFGLVTHAFDVFGLVARRKSKQDQGPDDPDWERKTFWIILTFTTMLMPALVCFSKLKRDKRHMYRHSLTDLQKAFFEGALFTSVIPSSWLRFLWFMTVLGIASFSLIAGQAFASLYLQTLPHTSLDAAAWVYTWVGTVTLLNQLSVWIIGSKIRSRALLFLYKYFFQVVLFTFYRNLFARLRSPQQFAVVQLLSSVVVIVVFPLQVTRRWHRVLQLFLGYDKTYEEYLHAQSITFYVRGLAQNVTALSFLGWLCILHFGPNSQRYPFFRFSYSGDPYTFQLTFLATLAVWTLETISSYFARKIMTRISGVDCVEVGIDEVRQYPELSVACGWASIHILSNILLFLINLDFE